jgi:hypothetical protein
MPGNLNIGGRCLLIQADSFDLSRIQTAIVAVVTSNVELADAPGYTLICWPAGQGDAQRRLGELIGAVGNLVLLVGPALTATKLALSDSRP